MTPLWIFKDIGTLNELFPFAKLAICQQSMPNPQANSTPLHSTHLFISSCRYFMLVCTNFGLGFIEKSLSTIWTIAMNLSLTESNFHKVLCLKIKSYRLPIVISQKKKEISWLSPFWGNGRKTRHISAVRGNLFTAHSIVIPFSTRQHVNI